MQEQLLCFSSFTFPLSPFHLPEDLSKAQTETPSAVIWFACVYVRDVPEDPEGQKCIFLFLYQRIIQFISLQGLQGHHERTHNQTETRLKTFV